MMGMHASNAMCCMMGKAEDKEKKPAEDKSEEKEVAEAQKVAEWEKHNRERTHRYGLNALNLEAWGKAAEEHIKKAKEYQEERKYNQYPVYFATGKREQFEMHLKDTKEWEDREKQLLEAIANPKEFYH